MLLHSAVVMFSMPSELWLLLLIPFVLAEAVMLWILWHLWQDSHKRR
ncbi:hypothetical protein [Terracidiphilus gabretensis]|nr:hypothetical protein [Terracidiphilus gabretensis]